MLHQQIDQKISEKEAWVLRRQLGIPNNKRLWVLACMDERLPVEKALGIGEGDAHIFRNAGGLVTDDAIRSAMLTTQFFGTKEIIVINHTECGMMTASGDFLSEVLRNQGIDVDRVNLDPALPELKLPKGVFSKWIKTFTDVDEICTEQVQLLRNSPLIPQDVVIHGYIWEVESMSLRHPYKRLSEKVNTASAMDTKTTKHTEPVLEIGSLIE
ncbi:carbonic anhydrase [Nostoc sp. 'Peltigera membranacea cyanobiont' 210A]|uniref:beta-class carbonic anhydrase n=1 Tax=Nostoc sp. 'Peltigera membranacea cyanobiont' 210A TaxID=2014529 RepID=UPI000B959814|nr:carbonic anhydrase [Nostoc sp. 'Peltigera membranacea cyanobiont' 210A]OYD93315.1 carbonic anhydrase [Nostoc sp. 'Peltigera membranacea cyanobiont' 210A]